MNELTSLQGRRVLLTQAADFMGPALAEVFREAVRRNATAIAVAHNHPSGDPTPSRDDIEFTSSLVQAGQLIDIELLDHIVFLPTVSLAPYPALRAFAQTFGARDSARRTGFRFDGAAERTKEPVR